MGRTTLRRVRPPNGRARCMPMRNRERTRTDFRTCPTLIRCNDVVVAIRVVLDIVAPRLLRITAASCLFRSLFNRQSFRKKTRFYQTYAEWWQAQRPPAGPLKEKDATFSTSYWPYGRRISCITTMDKEGQFYHLDKRLMRNHTFYKDRRSPSWRASELEHPAWKTTRSRSSAELLGSQAEHFGYHRSLGGRSSLDVSHASASFHEQNPIPFGEPFASTTKSGRNVWDVKKAQPPPQLPAAGQPTAGQRAASAPSTSRSIEAQAGTSRYDPKQSSRNLGLGQRTHAEWCLPQPPAYAYNSS